MPLDGLVFDPTPAPSAQPKRAVPRAQPGRGGIDAYRKSLPGWQQNVAKGSDAVMDASSLVAGAEGLGIPKLITTALAKKFGPKVAAGLIAKAVESAPKAGAPPAEPFRGPQLPKPAPRGALDSQFVPPPAAPKPAPAAAPAKALPSGGPIAAPAAPLKALPAQGGPSGTGMATFQDLLKAVGGPNSPAGKKFMADILGMATKAPEGATPQGLTPRPY